MHDDRFVFRLTNTKDDFNGVSQILVLGAGEAIEAMTDTERAEWGARFQEVLREGAWHESDEGDVLGEEVEVDDFDLDLAPNLTDRTSLMARVFALETKLGTALTRARVMHRRAQEAEGAFTRDAAGEAWRRGLEVGRKQAVEAADRGVKALNKTLERRLHQARIERNRFRAERDQLRARLEEVAEALGWDAGFVETGVLDIDLVGMATDRDAASAVLENVHAALLPGASEPEKETVEHTAWKLQQELDFARGILRDLCNDHCSAHAEPDPECSTCMALEWLGVTTP